MVIIISYFDQRVNVTLCSRASPLRQRKSRSIVGRFDGSKARQTQNTSVYMTDDSSAPIHQQTIGLTLVQDIREVVLRHF